MLSMEPEQAIRYIRQMIIPGVGTEGQEKIARGSVAVIGLGGLGAPVALYLAAAGVGKISLIDGDDVEVSNLHRQVLFHSSDPGKKKAIVAEERLRLLNPHIEIEAHPVQVMPENVLDVISEYGVVVDGSDNFPTRYLLNDACVLLGKPLVYGSIFRFEGQVSVFYAREGPCYRCFQPELPRQEAVPSCAEGGVLGPLPGIVGSFQALEVLKLILGIGSPLFGKVLHIDGKEGKIHHLQVPKNLNCPVCAKPLDVQLRYEEQWVCRTESAMTDWEVSPQQVKEMMELGVPITLLDVREAEEYAYCNISGTVWIPLRELPNRLHQLDTNQRIVCYCHTGFRSLRAAQILRAAGFPQAWSMKGGIEAWAVEIDPSIPRY